MARSTDLRIRIDADFPGEASFKSAQAAAQAMARELDKLEAAQRRMAAQEFAAYAEQARMAQEAADAVVAANEEQSDAMQSVGTVALTIGAATVTGLGLAAKAASDWESAWAGVNKTVDGSPKQMADLEKELRGLAKTLPSTHEEIAGVAEAAGQLGVKRADIAGFTKTMIDLGQSMNLTADEASTSLAQLMNVMGTAPQDVSRLGSALVALGNDGASTEADIVKMASYIAGAASLVGASESDVLALSNAMTSMGINAERGGGVMTRVLQDIYTAVQDGGDALDGFAEVAGVSSAEFAAAFRDDPIAAVDSFVQGLNRIDASGGNVVGTLNDMGYVGTQDTAVLLQLKGAGDLVADSLQTGNDAWRENNALTEEANKRYDTTESRLAMARNAINDVAIDIGGNLLPVLAQGSEFVANLAAAFGGLTAGQQKTVTMLGLGAGALIGMAGAASIAIPKMIELKVTLDALAGGSSRMGRGLGAAVGVLAGPWGLAIAAASVLLTIFVAKQGAAKRDVDALASALDAQTGAITESARAMKIDQLVDDGVYAQAERLGISLELVTDAALGSKAAMGEVDAAIEAAYNKSSESAGAFDSMGQGLDAGAEAAAKLQNALHGSAEQTSKAQQQAQLKAEAMGEDALATTEAGDAAEETASKEDLLVDALSRGESSTGDLTDAVDALSKALDVLNGVQLSANDANRAWHESVDAATAALAENGQTLDVTTEAGRSNSAALDGMAQAGMDNAEAILRNTGSIADFQGALAASRQSLLETAMRFGLSREAATAYVDSVLAVPDAASTKILLEGVQSANAQIDTLLAKITRFDGKVATTTLVTRNVSTGTTSVTQSKAQADGGVMAFYAAGGVAENHVAALYPAGITRVFNEPETGGEGYIPMALSKRERSKAITEEIVGRFGGQVAWFADGGTLGVAPGQTVNGAFLRSQLAAPAPGPVSTGRYVSALAEEALAAGLAERAEARLAATRAEGEAQIEGMKKALDALVDVTGESQDAAVEALREQMDAWKQSQSEAAEATKTRYADEATALKDHQADEMAALKRHNDDVLAAFKASTEDQGAISARSRELEDSEKALSRAHDVAEREAKRAADDQEQQAKRAVDAEEEAWQQRITEAKKSNEAATKALKESNDARLDAAEAVVDARIAAAEDQVTAAKEDAKIATDELRASEEELAQARERAVQLAQQVAASASRGGGLVASFDDRRLADARAASAALSEALADADGAGSTVRGENRAAALDRRTQALREATTAAEAYAASQEALGATPAAVQASLAAAVERVRQLGAAYGLAAEDVAKLTASLTDRGRGGDLLASMQAEAARTEELASLVRQLTEAGLDRSLLDEVIAGGTGAGITQARSLLAGGPALITGLNETYGRIQTTANELGTYVSSTRYDPNQPQRVALAAGTSVALATDTSVGLVSGTSVGIDDAAILELSSRLEAAFRATPIKVTVNGGGGGGPLPPLGMAP